MTDTMADMLEPPPTTEREYTATAKGGRLVYWLMVAGPRTYHEIACELECSERHAYRVVNKVALSVPIAQDEHGRVMVMMDANDWL